MCHDFGTVNYFINKDKNTKNERKRINIKIKDFWSSKDTIKGGKRQTTVGEIISTAYIIQ